jgi:hypothetical protein
MLRQGNQLMMHELKPKEQHELILASADKKKIEQHLTFGRDQDVTRIALALARQCDLFVHFRRLWTLRVADLDQELTSEKYMKNIFVNRRALSKQLSDAASS